MVTVKEAVANAVQFANSVLDPARTTGMRLEEVDFGEEKNNPVWLITLSMPVQNSLVNLGLGREYKTFAVHKGTGEVLAMRIRELVGAQ